MSNVSTVSTVSSESNLTDDLQWKECEDVIAYTVQLPGRWEDMEKRIWKTSKGEYFQITLKKEAIYQGIDESIEQNKKLKVTTSDDTVDKFDLSFNL